LGFFLGFVAFVAFVNSVGNHVLALVKGTEGGCVARWMGRLPSKSQGGSALDREGMMRGTGSVKRGALHVISFVICRQSSRTVPFALPCEQARHVELIVPIRGSGCILVVRPPWAFPFLGCFPDKVSGFGCIIARVQR
jgi:hypothetical protein